MLTVNSLITYLKGYIMSYAYPRNSILACALGLNRSFVFHAMETWHASPGDGLDEDLLIVLLYGA